MDKALGLLHFLSFVQKMSPLTMSLLVWFWRSFAVFSHVCNEAQLCDVDYAMKDKDNKTKINS